MRFARRKGFGWLGWVLLGLVSALGPTAAGAAQAADRVVLRMHWVSQAQFAGFYMAMDEGIFQKHDLDVELLAGGPGIDPLEELATGKADFVTAWLAPALILRANGTDLLHLAQLIQRSSLLLIAFKDSGITEVGDLEGRKVSLWDAHFSLPAKTMFRHQGIEVVQVPQAVTLEPFIYRAVDAASAMLYNEYHRLYQAGVEPQDLTVFSLAELGYNFPEDGIYTRAGMWRRRPDICRRFVAACLEGWRLAFAQPEKALTAVMRRVEEAKLASNPAHQRWMLKTMGDLMTFRVGEAGMGELYLGDLERVNLVLKERGLINRPVAAADFVAPAWR